MVIRKGGGCKPTNTTIAQVKKGAGVCGQGNFKESWQQKQ